MAETINATRGRPLSGVFIQQEQEGNLLESDSRDSGGSVFNYYRPTEMVPDLIKQVVDAMPWYEKTLYQARKFFLKDPWKSFFLGSKLRYLSALEAHITQAQGKEKAWDGKTSLILKKRDGAPAYISDHPVMENPPFGRSDRVGAAFLRPEIVTAKDKPAQTVAEAVGRSREIIADTGHAGIHYHVFVKLPPEKLKAGLPALQSGMQYLNDQLFLEAAVNSGDNLVLPSLLPWHSGRADTMRKIVEEGSPNPHLSDGMDPNSVKHGFVGFRYWGVQDGQAVISLEFRGVEIPFKDTSPPRSAIVKGFDEGAPPTAPVRDYSQAERYLTFLALFARQLKEGKAPRLATPTRALDLKAANGLLDRIAKERGIASESFAHLEEFAGLVGVVDAAGQTHPSLLFPFSDAPDGKPSPALKAFINEYLDLAVETHNVAKGRAEIGSQMQRNLFYRLGITYQTWAKTRLADYYADRNSLYARLYGEAMETERATFTPAGQPCRFGTLAGH